MVEDVFSVKELLSDFANASPEGVSPENTLPENTLPENKANGPDASAPADRAPNPCKISLRDIGLFMPSLASVIFFDVFFMSNTSLLIHVQIVTFI